MKSVVICGSQRYKEDIKTFANRLRKLGVHTVFEPNFERQRKKMLKKEEKELVKALVDFPKVVEQAAREMRINHICNYAYDLANVFSTFYQFCPVLKAEKGQKNFRLALVAATKIVLRNALSILGIDAIEKM